MITDNTKNISSAGPKMLWGKNPAPSDPYVPVAAWDENDIIDNPIKGWVHDVRPDWRTGEIEAEDLINWEAD